jgi:16S rRNA (uracil1498-N3)-methyltransferase
MTPRVFAPDAAAARSAVDLSADEAHHVEHVLRLRAGDAVAVFDGAGGEWAARIASVGRGGVRVELQSALVPVSEPAVHVTIAVGLLKGDQMDTVVRDATMLGVAAIQPMITAHVAVSGKAHSGKGAARWSRVAVASAKQCGRAVVPRILSPAPFAGVIHEPARGEMFIAAEPRAGRPGAETPEGASSRHGVPARALALVGPEGGWSPDEVAQAVSAGARVVTLGPRTLRAESAPIVLLSVLWSGWGWP